MIHLFYISIIVMILVIHLCSRKSKCKKLVWTSIGDWQINHRSDEGDIMYTTVDYAVYEIWKCDGKYTLKALGQDPKKHGKYVEAVEKLNEFNSKSHKNE